MTRSRGATFACLLLGGLLAIVATAQQWWRAAGDGASVAFTGTEASGGLSQALALVSLAGTLLVLALRIRGRRVVAALLAVNGLGILAVGLLRVQPGPEAVRTKFRLVSLTDTITLTPSGWPWVFAGAGLVVLAGAALLWRGAPHWAPRPDRFARPSSPPPSAADPLDPDDDPAAAWRALDAGLDPTQANENPAEVTAGPDVPERATRGHNGVKPGRSRTGTSHVEKPSPREQGD